jgi:hypothetical protein
MRSSIGNKGVGVGGSPELQEVQSFHGCDMRLGLGYFRVLMGFIKGFKLAREREREREREKEREREW